MEWTESPQLIPSVVRPVAQRMLPPRNETTHARPLPQRPPKPRQISRPGQEPDADARLSAGGSESQQAFFPRMRAQQRPLPQLRQQLGQVAERDAELELEPEPEPEPMYPHRCVPAVTSAYNGRTAPISQWLALGDSYTIGDGVSESEGWPAQLAAQLEHPPQIITIARSGWTTRDLASAMEARMTPASLGRMAVVSLMIGVNDQIRDGNSPGTIFREAFAALLSRAVSLAIDTEPTRVVVLSIPDWTATPKGLQRSTEMDDGGHSAEVAEQQIARHNTVIKQTALDAGVHFVDTVTSISRQCLVRPELTGNDGLHPSALQYAEWAAAVLPAVQSALRVRA